MLIPGAAAALLFAMTQTAGTTSVDSDALLDCAADRYRAARVMERGKDAAGLVAAKGMGAIAPVGPRRAEAARLRAEGDAFRQRAGTDLSRRQVAAREATGACTAD